MQWSWRFDSVWWGRYYNPGRREEGESEKKGGKMQESWAEPIVGVSVPY